VLALRKLFLILLCIDCDLHVIPETVSHFGRVMKRSHPRNMQRTDFHQVMLYQGLGTLEVG
jgi:hypothetical protein